MNPSDPAASARAALERGPASATGSFASATSREAFARSFGRCFDRVYTCVARRIRDRALCEQIVREVLEVHLEIVAAGGDDRRSIRALEIACDARVEAASKSAPPAVSANRSEQERAPNATPRSGP